MIKTIKIFLHSEKVLIINNGKYKWIKLVKFKIVVQENNLLHIEVK